MLIVILMTLGGIFFLDSLTPNMQGPSSVEYCTEKCGNNDYSSSVNDTRINTVRCNCVLEVVTDVDIFGAKGKVDFLIYYFDSEDDKNLTRFEVIKRLKALG